MNPIFSRHTQTSSKNLSTFKDWYVQKIPYDLRLPCRLWTAKASIGDSRSWAVDENSSPIQVAVSNKARERLVAQMGDKSQIGASIAAEWRGSTEMIAKRATQIWKFTRSLRRGNLRDAAIALDIDVVRQKNIINRSKRRGYITKSSTPTRATIKNFGGLWLEYSYGWAPLVSDIYASTQIIDRPIKDITIRGRAYNQKQVIKPPVLYGGTWYNETWVEKCQMIADIKVTNPNLYLSNQLGLVNPAQWLLEGIPFSFVVDWFSNISQWVSQLTDFVGLELIQPMTTRLVTYQILQGYVYGGIAYPAFNDQSFVCLKRSSGIPPVSLHFGYEIPNWKRGLNAISLLTQALRH